MTQTEHRSDNDLKNSIIEELGWTPSVNPTHIGVAVNHGTVTLSGEVDTYPEKLHAEKAALRVRGVTGIALEITVRSTFGLINDTDIAHLVGEAIDRAVDVPRDSVKAAVHDHVVTLTGAVAWNYQRESASRAVRYIKGVRDVFNKVTVEPTASAAGIKTAIAEAMLRSAVLDAKQTTVTSDPDGTVTLKGMVQSWAERHQAEQIAWAAPGVSSVINQIQIKN